MQWRGRGLLRLLRSRGRRRLLRLHCVVLRRLLLMLQWLLDSRGVRVGDLGEQLVFVRVCLGGQSDDFRKHGLGWRYGCSIDLRSGNCRLL